MDTKMPTKVRKWADHTMGANRMVSHCIPMWEQCSCHPMQLQSLQHMWPSRHLLHALRYPSHFDSPDYQKPPTLLGLPLSFSPCPDLQSEVGFLLPHRTLSLCTSLQFSRVPSPTLGHFPPFPKNCFLSELLAALLDTTGFLHPFGLFGSHLLIHHSEWLLDFTSLPLSMWDTRQGTARGSPKTQCG